MIFVVTAAGGWAYHGAMTAAVTCAPPSTDLLQGFLTRYREAHLRAIGSIPLQDVAVVAEVLKDAHREDRSIFVVGNGGAAASASHFATDLGKGASDRLDRRFRVLSLTDNVAWISALGNDYAYEDVFVRQLMNHSRPGDVVISVSVSGDSPNCVKALQWARQEGLRTVAMVGGRKGRTAGIADHVIEIPDTHYGRVEDAHMTVLHMLAYAFMENAWESA